MIFHIFKIKYILYLIFKKKLCLIFVPIIISDKSYSTRLISFMLTRDIFKKQRIMIFNYKNMHDNFYIENGFSGIIFKTMMNFENKIEMFFKRFSNNILMNNY